MTNDSVIYECSSSNVTGIAGFKETHYISKQYMFRELYIIQLTEKYIKDVIAKMSCEPGLFCETPQKSPSIVDFETQLLHYNI